MKKTYVTLLLSSGMAMAAYEPIDLSPTAISTGRNAQGITASDVISYTPNAWKGTWETDSLNGQVSAANGILTLQIGAAASNNSGGNFAAVKFEAPANAPLTLTFDIGNGSKWGNNNSFAAQYSCTVYGFNEGQDAITLQTWSDDVPVTSAQTYSQQVTLNNIAGGYDAYGIIFHAMETSQFVSGAGVILKISNIMVTPEPATATLSLLALAGLAARRRRK